MAKKRLSRLKKDISGATSIEYGLIVVGLCITIVTVLYVLGDQIVLAFEYLREQMLARTP